MSVRAFYRTAKVASAAPRYDTLNLKIYYPAAPTGSEEERNSGVIPAERSAAPFPVVIVMPGINVDPQAYGWLAIALAKRGIVTVTYQWVAEEMPGYISITPGFDLSRLTPETYGSAPTAIALDAILGLIGELNTQGPLADTLDLDNIVLGGHSAGGSLALFNGNPAWFPAIKGVFSYAAHCGVASNLGFAENTVLAIPSQLPTLIMGGSRDGVIAASVQRYAKDNDPHPTQLIERSFREAIQSNRGDCYLAIIEGANHFSFTHPFDATTGRPFLDMEESRDGDTIRTLMARLVASFIRGTVLNMGEDSNEPDIASVAEQEKHGLQKFACR